MTENPEKFIKLLKSLISENGEWVVDWVRGVKRTSDTHFIAERGSSGNVDFPVVPSDRKRKYEVPLSFRLQVRLPLWSEEQKIDFIAMIPRGGKEGKKAAVSGISFDTRTIRLVAIYCDDSTDVHKLLVGEGILNLIEETFG